MRGQNEDMANQLTTLQKQQKDYYTDLDGAAEEVRAAAADGGWRAGRGAAGRNRFVQCGIDSSSAAATSRMRRRRSAAFISKYPHSPYQPTAQYWLGNALYALRDYKGSTATWQGVVKNYPQHPRAPEALLAIANNQLEQGQKAAAKKTLEQIVAQYGGSDVAQSAQSKLSQIK